MAMHSRTANPRCMWLFSDPVLDQPDARWMAVGATAGQHGQHQHWWKDLCPPSKPSTIPFGTRGTYILCPTNTSATRFLLDIPPRCRSEQKLIVTRWPWQTTTKPSLEMLCSLKLALVLNSGGLEDKPFLLERPFSLGASCLFLVIVSGSSKNNKDINQPNLQRCLFLSLLKDRSPSKSHQVIAHKVFVRPHLEDGAPRRIRG